MKKTNQVRINDFELEMILKALEIANDIDHQWIYTDIHRKLKREESKRAQRIYE